MGLSDVCLHGVDGVRHIYIITVSHFVGLVLTDSDLFGSVTCSVTLV